jgi:hypothetical protein
MFEPGPFSLQRIPLILEENLRWMNEAAAFFMICTRAYPVPFAVKI